MKGGNVILINEQRLELLYGVLRFIADGSMALTIVFDDIAIAKPGEDKHYHISFLMFDLDCFALRQEPVLYSGFIPVQWQMEFVVLEYKNRETEYI